MREFILQALGGLAPGQMVLLSAAVFVGLWSLPVVLSYVGTTHSSYGISARTVWVREDAQTMTRAAVRGLLLLGGTAAVLWLAFA